MKFKDVFARWARIVAGYDSPPLTDEDKLSVTQDLDQFVSYLDMSANGLCFNDLVVRAKTKNPNEQEITIQIVFTKMGTGGLIIKDVE